jgi:arsenate reductase
MTTIYGIKNCDTVKKSLKWLEKNNIEFTFHDFRVDGLTPELLSSLVARSDWSVLLNKRSTTFRNLPAEIKDNLTDDVIFKAVIEQPTLLKRPILISNDKTCVGFKDNLYQENLL